MNCVAVGCEERVAVCAANLCSCVDDGLDAVREVEFGLCGLVGVSLVPAVGDEPVVADAVDTPVVEAVDLLLACCGDRRVALQRIHREREGEELVEFPDLQRCLAAWKVQVGAAGGGVGPGYVALLGVPRYEPGSSKNPKWVRAAEGGRTMSQAVTAATSSGDGVADVFKYRTSTAAPTSPRLYWSLG